MEFSIGQLRVLTRSLKEYESRITKQLQMAISGDASPDEAGTAKLYSDELEEIRPLRLSINQLYQKRIEQ